MVRLPSVPFASAILLTFSRLPESPRWLIDHDRHEDGFKVLRKLHTRPDDPEEIVAREEYLQIRRQIELERADQLNKSWATLFKKPSLRKRLILGFGTQFIAQSTGKPCMFHQPRGTLLT